MPTVAAIQMPFAWASSPQEYFDRCNAPIARAAEQGARLVVLPQYIGDMLIGVQVPVDPTSSFMDVVQAGGFSNWYMCVRRTASMTAQFYVHTFETLAKRYGVYLVPGTISLPGEDLHSLFADAEVIFHASFLFAPNGQLLGEQRQTHRTHADTDEMGVGDTLTLVDSEVGRIGLLVGADVYHPEVARILCLQGANVLINPIAMPTFSAGYWLRGLWREVQSNPVFGIEAPLAGGGYHGRATIHAPLELTSGRTGVLAQAQVDDDVAVVCASLDFDALQQAAQQHPLRALNRALIEGEVAEAYRPQLIEMPLTHGGSRKFRG